MKLRPSTGARELLLALIVLVVAADPGLATAVPQMNDIPRDSATRSHRRTHRLRKIEHWESGWRSNWAAK